MCYQIMFIAAEKYCKGMENLSQVVRQTLKVRGKRKERLGKGRQDSESLKGNKNAHVPGTE